MTSIYKKYLFILLSCCVSLIFIGNVFAQGHILVNTDISEIENTFVLDADDTGGDITLQFGNSLNRILKWDATGIGFFSFNDNVSLSGNQLLDFRLENSGSSPLCDGSYAGRLYHNTLDTKTYVCDGTSWQDLTAIYTTATKVVTVGSVGSDYATIANAAGYLNTLSGGIMLLSAETHAITTPINLQNITLIGKDDSNTTIQISGGGQIDSFDTSFQNVKLDVNSITDTMAIDVASGSNSLYFEWVDFDIQDGTDVLIDSNSGTAPTVTVKFIKCDQSGGSGDIVHSIGSGNLSASSSFFVDSRSADSALEVADWNVALVAGGNVNTTGTIYPIPASSIIVSPDMNLQGAIDSLELAGVGGLITLLPGTHVITQPITIEGDNIEIIGYGDSSIISASGFTGITDTTAALQVGLTDGTAPADGIVFQDFKVEVSSNIHGIRVAGGSDNQIYNITVQKMLGTSGSAATANVGIQLLDGASTDLLRPVVTNSRVFGNGGTNYFTDGIHVTSDNRITGAWGYGNNITNALIEGNNVDYVSETGFVFIGPNNSSLFNNIASRMGAGGAGAYGIFMGNISNINMTGNVFSGSLSITAIAIGIDSFNVTGGSSTVDSIFNNNVVDGTGNGGVGFGTGFQIGNITNTTVHRNSFQNNSILGASNTGGTRRAIDVRGDADNNSFSGNDISGGTNNWNTGIDLASSTQDQNLVLNNRYINVDTNLADLSTYSKISVLHHRSTTDPTINDDANDGYEIGTVWINTSSDSSWILTDSAVGAAVWNLVDGSMLGQFYDSAGGTDVNSVAPIAIPWASETRKDTGITHSAVINSERVYLDNADWYHVSYNVSHESQTNGRKNVRCRIRLNGTTFVTPSDSYSYSRNLTDEWATNTAFALVQTTTTNEYYEVMCNAEGSANSANTVSNESWTLVEKK